jgi:lipoprotein NlpI
MERAAAVAVASVSPTNGRLAFAAEKGEGEARRNQLCYAHLYLGLYFEALGDAVKAREHIRQAAGPFRMNHYMGKVAVMHELIRSGQVNAPAHAR